MNSNHFKTISNFFVAGINYRKSDVLTRGQFSVNEEDYRLILQHASALGLNELFILSTCNRTEIYGFAQNSGQLIDALCSRTKRSAKKFREVACIKTGCAAIEHIFNVAAGLDSQILGDYEIVGQLKSAVKLAKQEGFVGSFTERLINCVLQSSKKIKNDTNLSGGTVSVSFAAMRYIAKMVADCSQKKILLVGTGKIGRNTCRYLVDHIGTKNITLINRSPGKSAKLADELGLKAALASELGNEIDKADIIITATNNSTPVILSAHLGGKGEKLVIDLSVPNNVEESAGVLPNIHLVGVDELSSLKDETLKSRAMEVPHAKAIISEFIREFHDWCEMRQHAPMLNNLKDTLRSIHTDPMYSASNCYKGSKPIEFRIQRVLNATAGKVKSRNQRGCHYIAAINEFISAGAN